MRLSLVMVLLMACGSPEDLSFERDVQPMLFTQCGACHLGADAEAGLDLVTNPYAAVVDVPSGQAPYLLVQPGSGIESYLWHKLNGTQVLAEGAGASMPLGRALGGEELDLVFDWIEEGAAP